MELCKMACVEAGTHLGNPAMKRIRRSYIYVLKVQGNSISKPAIMSGWKDEERKKKHHGQSEERVQREISTVTYRPSL